MSVHGIGCRRPDEHMGPCRGESGAYLGCSVEERTEPGRVSVLERSVYHAGVAHRILEQLGDGDGYRNDDPRPATLATVALAHANLAAVYHARHLEAARS